MPRKVMSDWEVDGVADNAWSSFDEVAWIECESKGNHIVPEPGMLRSTQCIPMEPFQKAAGEPSGHVQKLSNHVYQKSRKLDHPDPSIKGETFAELNTQESGYGAKERITSPSKGLWRDNNPGSSLAVLPLNASNRSSSVIKGGSEVEPKKDISRYGFEGAIEMCKGVSGYPDDGADIVNNSCHFLLSDVCPPGGDLEFLADVHEEARRDNLLEYGWGNTNNLEDVDKLFSSADSMLSRGFDNNTDGMLWEPPSPTLGGSLESMHQPISVPGSPDFVSRDVVKGFETNTDYSMGKISAALTKQASIPEEWTVPHHSKRELTSNLEDSCLPMHVDNYTECSKGNTWESQGASEGHSRGSENIEDEASHAFNETEKWKTSKARRHGPRSKRLEENSRKPSAGRKLALNLAQAKKSSLIYVPVVSIAQESPPCSTATVSQVTHVSSCEPMQCMQPVPYVHAGFGFPAHHHLPVVVPSPVMPQQLQPQAQPVFIGYQPPFMDVPKLQQIKSTFDVSLQSPSASSTMTPQEKIEKLRWRQKMQARLAVEQQQQQLINQQLIPEQTQFGRQQNHQIHPQLNSSGEALGGSVRLAHSQCAEASIWNERSASVEGAMIADGDESLAATVLHELLHIASKMDTRTRLCLRDGFCRLAGNAMQRRAAGDRRDSKRKNSEPINRSCTADSLSTSEQSCSQRLLTVDDIVETETNPMDRFIAHLLFHKRFPSSFMPLYMNCTPCNNSENSEPGLLHQSAWPWNETNPSSHVSPATRSSSVSGELETSKGPNTISYIPTSDTFCEKRINRSACLSSVVSGLQLEKVLSFPITPDDNSLQHFVERGTDMGDVDTVVPAVITSSDNMDSFGEVEESLLQSNNSQNSAS
eukprot:c21255_g1_i1 orf=285-2903(-)